MQLTSYERYLAVCELREPDRVPVSPLIMTFAARHAGVTYSEYCRDPEVLAQAQSACIRRFGYDAVTCTSDSSREPGALGAEVIWPEDDVPGCAPVPFVTGSDDLSRLRLPDPLGKNRMADQITTLKILKEELGEDQVVYGWVEAPFQEATILRDVNYFMVDLYENVDFAHRLLRFSLEMELEFGLAQIEAGARFIGVGDSFASLASPEHYREFNYPYVVELISRLKKAGAKVKYHACGNTRALLPLYADLGADIINVEVLVDLERVKNMMGHKMCVKGNIDPVNVLLRGTKEDVIVASRRCIDVAGTGGGFILSPGCEVPRDTPAENLDAMIETAKTYGRYPLEGKQRM
jgi:MtaA/CmuA family methyltransferase